MNKNEWNKIVKCDKNLIFVNNLYIVEFITVI